jgi:SAM-dependent methyltransferase
MAGPPTEPLDELLDVRGRDVLDVGCGDGALVRRLADARARAVGLDPQAAALEQARAQAREGQTVRYVQGTAEDPPFADASFDVVIFFNSLHHVPPACMDRAVAEAARMLRPGGLLYVQEPVARGSAFELLRPVEDETQVRRVAQEALGRAASGGLARLVSREALLTVRHADFDALRARTISVEPARAAAFSEQEPALRAAFQRLGHPAPGGGYEFDQPFAISLFRV